MNYDIRVYAYYFISAIAVRYGTVGRGRGHHSVWACWRLSMARTRWIICGHITGSLNDFHRMVRVLGVVISRCVATRRRRC